MKRPVAILSVLCGALLGAAAPAPKAKPTEDAGPVTGEQLRTASNNLKQIALAWHNYESAHTALPTNVADKTGKPLLSWRVQILPYIEQDELWKQFKLDEPWDSDHNRKLIGKMPKLYAPVRGRAEAGETFYQSFTGKRGLIKPGQNAGLGLIPDGTSNTLLVAEAARPVIWTKPDDLVFDGKQVPALGGMFGGQFHAAFCDGSVYRFKNGVDPRILALLIDPNDGNVIPDLRDSFDIEEDRK